MKNNRNKYFKPRMKVLNINMGNIVCSIPNIIFYEGGGGVYDNGSIWDNGEDY